MKVRRFPLIDFYWYHFVQESYISFTFILLSKESFCLLMHIIKFMFFSFTSVGAVTTFSELYSNLFTYPLYIGICLLLMLVWSFTYMVLAIYIERINPGEFGVSQPWYFLFKRTYWRPRQVFSIQQTKIDNTENTDSSTTEDNRWIEVRSPKNPKLPALSINQITKVRNTATLPKFYKCLYVFHLLTFRNSAS